MKGIYYAIRHLARRKRDSLVKVFALTSGIVAGMVLVAKIAFDLSYDRWIPGAENLYRIQSLYTTHVGTAEENTLDYSHTLQPVAPTAAAEIPGVEAGTSIYEAGERAVFISGERYEVKAIYADTSFFSTMRLPVLSGDTESLGVKGNVFLSESLAWAMFGDGDPSGRSIFTDKSMQEAKTVTGIFRDIPANSHLDFDIVFSPMEEVPWSGDWDRGDGFTGYVRLSPGADPGAVDKALPEMMRRHMDMKLQSDMGYSFSAYIKPVKDLHTDDRETRQTLAVLGVFAFLLIVTVSLNYVLASVSSLDSRARDMAVFKCSGATSGDIFISTLWESVFLILVSVSLSFILLYAGKDIIESLTGVPLRNLFSYGQLTGYALASLLVTAIAGLIPAKIFSSVPAMDIFRRGARDRNMWKHVLLFIQVACSAAITGFLVIAVSQYRFMTGKDMGYDAGQLAYCSFDRVEQSGRQMIKDRLMQVPGIEGVTFSENIPTRKFYGMQLVDPGSGETVATCRYTFVDTDFIRTLGIALTEGSDIPGEMSDPSPALVNRRLTDALGWDGSPTGRVLPQNGIVVSGVIGDFTMQSIFLEQDPVCLLPLPEGFRRLYLTIRFSEITPEALSGAESLLKRLSPENDIILRTYRDDIHESYRDTEHFRNSVLAAAAFMLLIVLAGLVGFVSDEMRRRRKENALRRVNGASAADIQTMMLRNIGKICIPAVLAGLMLAAIAAFRWLQHFPEKIRPHFLLFLATGLVLAAVILACVSLCTFKAAAANPARHLRSE